MNVRTFVSKFFGLLPRIDSHSNGRRRPTTAQKFSTLEQLENRLLLTNPVIANFAVALVSNGYFDFTGTVVNGIESTEGYEISFGEQLQGWTTCVDCDGNFELMVQMSTQGEVTAQTANWNGTLSNLASVKV